MGMCKLLTRWAFEYFDQTGNLVSSIGGVTTYDATLTMLQQITGPELANQVAEALYYFPWLERGTAGETR